MKFQIGLLRVAAVTFDLFGIAYLFMPQQLSALLGMQLIQPSAIGDVRAMYGGLSCGIAIFLWLCARPDRARLGVQLLALIGAGLMTGRLMGMVVDGAPNMMALALFVTEVATTVASALALRAQPSPVRLQAA